VGLKRRKRMADVKETLQRIKSHKGVEGVIIVNSEGVPIRPSKGMDDELTQKYAANISQLAAKARAVVRELDPTNELTFLRLRTKKHELMVAPEKDYIMIVIQNPNEASKK